MVKPTRPVLRYHGGKWRLAPWIISHFPAHRIYVEPYGGAASVLMRKTRSYAEVYNDLDGEVVNVFRVLRDPELAEGLTELLRLTPYSRDEFGLAYEHSDDPVEQARRTLFRAGAGFGSVAASGRKTGFRDNSMRSGSTPAHGWSRFPEQVAHFVSRLAGVVIDNRPALHVIQRHDSPDTLFYVDPPYPFSTRTPTAKWDRIYRHEMEEEDHRALAEVLHTANGAVVISGYGCPLYDDDLYPDWQRVERRANGAGKTGSVRRTEVLWISPNCESPTLFT